MKNSLTIMKISGIKIRLHISWLLVLAILTYALATNFYPIRYEFDTVTNWLLGGASAILLFVSVLIHELAHSIIAQSHKLGVRSITLFFFGGLANIESDPEKPIAEFRISIGGPLASLGLGILFYILYIANLGTYFTPMFDYLSKVNFILAIFNMIPAFPLDGGRIFRSILWAYMEDLKKATRIASNSGKIFGSLLVALGIVLFPGGMWFILLGLFLMFLAESGYKQVLMKFALDKINIKDLVHERPLIDPEWTIDEFLKWCRKENVLSGIATKNGEYFKIDLNNLPPINKKTTEPQLVKSLMTKITPIKVEDYEPFQLFKEMQNNNISIMPVVENDNYIGVISTDAMNKFIKIESIQETLPDAPKSEATIKTNGN